jgi:hypothetical protein
MDFVKIPFPCLGIYDVEFPKNKSQPSKQEK